MIYDVLKPFAKLQAEDNNRTEELRAVIKEMHVTLTKSKKTFEKSNATLYISSITTSLEETVATSKQIELNCRRC